MKLLSSRVKSSLEDSNNNITAPEQQRWPWLPMPLWAQSVTMGSVACEKIISHEPGWLSGEMPAETRDDHFSSGKRAPVDCRLSIVGRSTCLGSFFYSLLPTFTQFGGFERQNDLHEFAVAVAFEVGCKFRVRLVHLIEDQGLSLKRTDFNPRHRIVKLLADNKSRLSLLQTTGTNGRCNQKPSQPKLEPKLTSQEPV